MPKEIDKSKNLKWPEEICTSFGIIAALGVISLCLSWVVFGQGGYMPTIWVILSIIMVLGCVLAQTERLKKRKRWKNVAEFGQKIWYFPNLWYVIFLVAGYATVMDVSQQMIEKSTGFFDVSILLVGARDLVLAVFLAVVTSVLAHTFWGISKSASNIDTGVKQLNTITNDVENLGLRVRGAIGTLGAIAQLSEYSARVCELTRVANEIASFNKDLGPFREALEDLSNEIISYNKTALLPLFPPDIDIPSKDKDTFPDLIKSIKDNTEHQQHCSYMAVAVGRYLEAEASERSFRGILLNVTSFVYYAQTAERVVNALQAWPDDFHFYTLMPKSPAELFRFSNTIDLEQWLGFLENYNKFQREVNEKGKGKGKWIRYFAYAETSGIKGKKEYSYSSKKNLKEEIKTGYVKCEKGSNWKPQILSNKELKELIDNDIVAGDREDALSQNKIHGNRGTCVIVGHDIDRRHISSWTRLEDAIINLHVDKEHFRYRSMKDIEDIFDKNITLEISSKRQCKIKLPRDIVAVRRASIDAKPEDWILLIGLDEYFIGTKGSQMGLAFSPVLDLCCMAQTGENNKKGADEIRRFLQTIFLPENKDGIFTHAEFKNKYINNNT